MKKNPPKISLVTPSYNQAQYIEQTIQSVLSQNYPNLEYLIIDAGSTDGTLEILRKYKGKLRWISKKDRGQSDAINKGLKIVSGEILGFLNSDDISEENALFKVANYFSENSDIFWVTGKCHVISDSGQKQRNFVTAYKNFFLKFLRSRNALLVTNFISQPATFWRKEVWEKVGSLDESYHFSMDYDYWLRIFAKYKLGFIDDYLASFRVHGRSKGASNLSGQLKESFGIAEKFTSSPVILFFHHLHDIISSYLYRSLYSIK